MQDGVVLNTSALENLQEKMLIALKDFPEEVEIFLKDNAKEVKKIALKRAKAETNKKTGNYLKGFKVSKAFVKNGRGYIKTYNSQHHAHLIEYGYIHTGHKPDKKRGNKVNGKDVLSFAELQFLTKYVNNAQNFLSQYFDEVL